MRLKFVSDDDSPTTAYVPVITNPNESLNTPPTIAPWPAKTSVCCWHCCHPFGQQPVPLATKHDSRKDAFEVFGTFCSFNCAKTYAREHRLSDEVNLSTTLLRKRWTGKLTPLPAAPPRASLEMFGGPMSITQFRESVGKIELLPMPPTMALRSTLVELRSLSVMELDHKRMEQTKAILSQPLSTKTNVEKTTRIVATSNLRMRKGRRNGPPAINAFMAEGAIDSFFANAANAPAAMDTT